MKTEIVIILGPTAVGKSDFAVEYAIKNNGEIISADSRQVYKKLDIGTGKITKEEMKGIPHYLLDIVDAKEQFNVDKWKTLAEKAIVDISNRGKLPIICGGTGFYIDALVNDISYPDIPHNEKLREELKDKDKKEKLNILEKLDKDYVNRLNNSEKNNKQRLIRAIEIVQSKGKMQEIIHKKDNDKYDVTWIGLNCDIEILKERIHNRLIKRIEKGMIEEVEDLYKQGLSWNRMEELGLEYRYISRYLRGMITKEEMIKQLELEINHYAKRQMVWFKRNKKIEWV
jgi:tRNA dimethylallyltransferase